MQHSSHPPGVLLPICEDGIWVKIRPKSHGEPIEVKSSLRRVALIYNPASGQVSARRSAAVREAISVFRDAGLHVESFETVGPGSAGVHAKNCAAAGFDTVIACGGDGTVHEVLQSLVGTSIALGVLPLGTANALAANLGLVAAPAEIARTLLQASLVRVPIGRIKFQDQAGQPASRYFVVAAGVGADALLMARLDSRLKRRLGYILYVLEAIRIWATHPFPLFDAELVHNGTGSRDRIEVSQVLAVRVRSFGGVLGRLAPGATIHNPHLQLIAFKTRSRLHYLRFLIAVVVGRPTYDNIIQLHASEYVECHASKGADALYVEADGEVLGHLPVQISVVPDALTLLVPQGAEP
jgi:diacylglycerol kinase (ATP)